MMWEALREAVDEEMEADPTVLVMGAPTALHVPCMWSIRHQLLQGRCRRS